MPKNSNDKPSTGDKNERLAKNLRANLRRRKAAAKKLKDIQSSSTPDNAAPKP